MKSPPASLLAKLSQAAELRAGGASWESIGQKLGRSSSTVRHWPSEYPEIWQRLLEQATQRVLTEGCAEAITTLRQLLRSDDDKIKSDAAKVLSSLQKSLQTLDRRRGQLRPASEALLQSAADPIYQLAKFVQDLDDAQISALLGELADHPAASASAAAAEATGEACPAVGQ